MAPLLHGEDIVALAYAFRERSYLHYWRARVVELALHHPLDVRYDSRRREEGDTASQPEGPSEGYLGPKSLEHAALAQDEEDCSTTASRVERASSKTREFETVNNGSKAESSKLIRCSTRRYDKSPTLKSCAVKTHDNRELLLFVEAYAKNRTRRLSHMKRGKLA